MEPSRRQPWTCLMEVPAADRTRPVPVDTTELALYERRMDDFGLEGGLPAILAKGVHVGGLD
jgi:hypothetical protein